MIIALFLSACPPGTNQCPNSGLVCVQPYVCNKAGDACIIGDCGDNKTDPGTEVCDDGNNRSDDGCSEDCKSTEQCGNGEINVGELCDDGNKEADDWCTFPSCQPARCGDEIVNKSVLVDGGPPEEFCDDGARERVTCDAGVCTACSRDCHSVVTFSGPYCGDGDAGVNHGVDVDAGEICDDGNTDDETACPYGVRPPCFTCDRTCKRVLGPLASGTYCGDGILQASEGEVCDDGNAGACGLCSEDCRQVQQLSVATGIIQVVPGNAVIDGETFTLYDGDVEKVFALHTDAGAPDSGRIRIFLDASDLANTVASRIAYVIGDAGLGITASNSGGEIYLMNQRPGGTGNWAIQYHPPGSGFVFSGMAGGAGRNCADRTGCTSNDDCKSRSCDGGACRPDAGSP